MALQSTDPIADMLTRIRNAAAVSKNVVRIPLSKQKKVIADELKRTGYVADVTIEKAKPQDELVVTINEAGQNTSFTVIERVSRPGRRVYVGAGDVPRVKSGRGIVLVSTSRGVMTGTEAVKQKLGGEVLLKVY